MQSSQRGMLKEAPFVNGKYKKGYLVCQKCYVKGLSGWTQGGASPYKTSLILRSLSGQYDLVSVKNRAQRSSLFPFLLQQTSLHNVERDLPFRNTYLLQNNCQTFMLEAASFPSDNKIVSQVVRNIMGLRSNGG